MNCKYVEENGREVVKVSPLDDPLHNAAWEALKVLDKIPFIHGVAEPLREALAAQGVTAEAIAAYEEAK